MARIPLLAVAVTLAASLCVGAQNTGAHPTSQTSAAASAGAASSTSTAPRSGNRQTPNAGGNRHSRNSARGQASAAPAANSHVGVIGDANSDGKLDRNAYTSDSAALPGVSSPHNALGVAPGTPIQVSLSQPVDSGHAHNGDTIRGVLAFPLGKLTRGSTVSLTVVAAAPAGQLGSSGVLSLQVVSINGEQILSQVITAEGQEGKKILPDDAPARGTDAVFAADHPITLPAA